MSQNLGDVPLWPHGVRLLMGPRCRAGLVFGFPLSQEGSRYQGGSPSLLVAHGTLFGRGWWLEGTGCLQAGSAGEGAACLWCQQPPLPGPLWLPPGVFCASGLPGAGAWVWGSWKPPDQAARRAHTAMLSAPDLEEMCSGSGVSVYQTLLHYIRWCPAPDRNAGLSTGPIQLHSGWFSSVVTACGAAPAAGQDGRAAWAVPILQPQIYCWCRDRALGGTLAGAGCSEGS